MNSEDDFFEDSGPIIGRRALETVAEDMERFECILNFYEV
jgi:hypothetical protein